MSAPEFRREICGSIVASNIDLPELEEPPQDSATSLPRYVFTLEAPLEPPEFDNWYHHWEGPDGELCLSFARIENNETLLRFPDKADFILSASRRQIHCYPHGDDVPLATLRHLLMNQVFPVVMAHHGSLVLHAAATVVAGEAVAFIGPSGIGKSTIAATFAVARRPTLADDCTVINLDNPAVPMVMPYSRAVRLWQDSVDALPDGPEKIEDYWEQVCEGMKRTYHFFGHATGPAPLGRVYLLGPSKNTRIHIDPMPAREALIEIVKFAFRLDIDQPAALQVEFEKARQMAALPIFFRLSMPRSLDRVRELPRLIAEHMTPSPW